MSKSKVNAHFPHFSEKQDLDKSENMSGKETILHQHGDKNIHGFEEQKRLAVARITSCSYLLALVRKPWVLAGLRPPSNKHTFPSLLCTCIWSRDSVVTNEISVEAIQFPENVLKGKNCILHSFLLSGWTVGLTVGSEMATRYPG